MTEAGHSMMIIFDNEGQRREFRRFLPEVKADLRVYGDALLGARYDRIIAFKPRTDGCSKRAYEDKLRQFNESVPCRLKVGGEMAIF